MQTVSSIANARTGFSARPVSVRELMSNLQADSVREAIASYYINDFHRRTGGSFGPLGIPLGSVAKLGDGSYQRSFQLGVASMKTLDDPVQGQTQYQVTAVLSAVRCFGTYSSFPSNTDSTYAVISLISINPNAQGTDQLVTTFHTPIQDDVKGGSIIFEATTIGNVIPSGTGIAIHVALWRHVDGDINAVTDKIHSALNDAVNKAASALAAGSDAADDTSASGGTIGDITQWSIGGIKPVDLLTLGLASLIAQFFADKLIGQNVFWVTGGELVGLAGQTNYNNSIYSSSDLTPDIPVNWPPAQEDNPLYSGGGGSYKTYFLLQVVPYSTLVTPNP